MCPLNAIWLSPSPESTSLLASLVPRTRGGSVSTSRAAFQCALCVMLFLFACSSCSDDSGGDAPLPTPDWNFGETDSAPPDDLDAGNEISDIDREDADEDPHLDTSEIDEPYLGDPPEDPGPETDPDVDPDSGLDPDSDPDTDPDRDVDSDPDADLELAEETGPPKTDLGLSCTANEDCESGLCARTTDSAGLVCTKSCGSVDDCGDPSEWACLALTGTLRCAPTCAGEVECPSGSFCHTDLTVGTSTMRVCYSHENVSCSGQDDCAPGEACAYINGGGDLIALCLDNLAGNIEVGGTCDPELEGGQNCTGDDCPAGTHCDLGLDICMRDDDAICAEDNCWPEGICAGPCEGDDDCPTDMVCSGYRERMDNRTDEPDDDYYENKGLCRPQAGSRAACDATEDCSGGEACGFDIDKDGNTFSSCRDAHDDAVAMGETCSDLRRTPAVVEAEAICANGPCVTGACTAPCESATDCGTPADWQCEDVYVHLDQTLPVCVPGPPCTSDTACGSDLYCTVLAAPDGPVGFCDTGYGNSAGEACVYEHRLRSFVPCSSSAVCNVIRPGWQCNLGLGECVPPKADTCARGVNSCRADSVCADRCESDGDCNAGEKCMGEEIGVISDNGTPGVTSDDLHAIDGRCRPLTGSLAHCNRNADCSGSEICRLIRKANGEPALVCADAVTGEGPGEVCGDLEGGATRCNNTLCTTNLGLAYASGICATPCAETGDCPPETECVDSYVFPAQTTPVKLCLP